MWAGSVAVATVGTGPDQAEALTFLVGEEVGEDRSGEARIVELQTQIIAALVGALRLGGPDLHTADIDPVARCVVAGTRERATHSLRGWLVVRRRLAALAQPGRFQWDHSAAINVNGPRGRRVITAPNPSVAEGRGRVSIAVR